MDLTTLSGWAISLLVLVVAARVLALAASRFLRPSLNVEDFTGADDTAGKGMSDVIRTELVGMREEGAGPALRVVTGTDMPVDLPEVAKSVDVLSALAAVVSYLPGRISSVSGRVHPAGALGEGVSLSIRGSSGRVRATTTIWARDFVRVADVPADIAADGKDSTAATTEVRQCLALAAAAWIAYQELQRMGPTDRSVLLTQDWKSYARFLVGARVQQAGMTNLARTLYLRALDGDPRNRGALFNLAGLDIAAGADQVAEDRLEAALEELRRVETDGERWRFDRLWYRARYNVEVARWNAYLKGGPDPLGGMAGRLRELIETSDRTFRELGGNDAVRLGGRHSELARFLVSIRDASIAFYADVAPRDPGEPVETT